MKKSCFYAGALAVLFASCSNEDGLTPQVGPGQPGGDVVNELKISLVSGAEAGTRTANGTGTENTLYDAFVFVKADADGPDAANGNAYDYKYVLVELTQGQTTAVVKHVEANSKVYVLANGIYSKPQAESLVTDLNNDLSGADKLFQELKRKPTKKYISELNSTSGRYFMSGMATVPALNNAGATTLAVSLKRDLAKVSFKVNKAGATGSTVRIKEVEEITVRRSADRVQPFAMKGTASTTYVLPYGFGDASYIQDGLKAGVLTPDNNLQTPENATDYSFIYTTKDLGTVTANDYTFSDFYVLPNAADIAEKGTIIVLKAKIQKQKADDANVWEDVATSKYYKARISSGINAYNTAQNSSYTITASIKGEGTDKPSGPDPDSPDAENTESDLNINVQVEPWSLVVSSQEIE